MSEDDPPEQVAAAAALDAEIDDVLAGYVSAGTDPSLLRLHASVRTDPPRALEARIAAVRDERVARAWRPVRIVLAALAYLFLSHGIGNFVVSSWVADNLHEAHSPHAVAEGSFALIAVGLAVAAGVRWRQMMPVSVGAGVPLALVFGIMGITELDEFSAGGALHLTQGLVGITLLAVFLRFRRDTRGMDHEEGA